MTLQRGKVGSRSINDVFGKTQTPVNAVAATGTLVIAEQVTAGDTFTIGGKVFTFVAAGTADANGEVNVGAAEENSKTNIIAAINGTDSVNTAHPTVSVGTFSGDNLTITAQTKGAAGNSIATTETFTRASNVFSAAVLSGGVDGTPGADGAMVKDTSYLYVATAENTISDANWRRISLGSVY